MAQIHWISRHQLQSGIREAQFLVRLWRRYYNFHVRRGRILCRIRRYAVLLVYRFYGREQRPLQQIIE